MTTSWLSAFRGRLRHCCSSVRCPGTVICQTFRIKSPIIPCSFHPTLVLISPCSVTSVFFGGGTPSLAHPSTIAAVLETVSRHANLSDKAEVTLEVNPTPAGMSKLEDYCQAGVNRFSIGVQVSMFSARLIIVDKTANLLVL